MIRVLPLLRLPALSPIRRLRQWSSLSRQRAALATLDDAALRDLGLTRAEARAEAARPFWDAPDHWRI